MNYSVLIYDTSDSFAQAHGPDARKFMSQWPPFIKALNEAGIFVSGAGLQPPDRKSVV